MASAARPVEVLCEECGVRVAFPALDKHLRQHRAYLAYSCGECQCRFFVFPDAQAHFNVGKIHAPGTPSNIIEELDVVKEMEIAAILATSKDSAPATVPVVAAVAGLKREATSSADPSVCPKVEPHKIPKLEEKPKVLKEEASARVLRPRTLDLEPTPDAQPSRQVLRHCAECVKNVRSDMWRSHLLSAHMKRASFRCGYCAYEIMYAWYPNKVNFNKHTNTKHPGQKPYYEDLRGDLLGELSVWKERCFPLPDHAE